MPPGITSSGLSTLRVFLGTNPAANAEVSEVVPTGKYWQLLAVTVLLAQGGAGSSQPLLTLDDGANVLFEAFGSSSAQAITTTCRYTWAPDLPLSGQVGATTNVHANAPLPGGLVLPSGGHIKTTTVGLSANTDYGVPTIYVVEFG